MPSLYDSRYCIETIKLLRELVRQGTESISGQVPQVNGGTLLSDDALLLEVVLW